MDCIKVTKEIDQWVYNDIENPGEDVIRHLNTCKACARYLEESRQAAGKIRVLAHREPVLKDPERLTEEILQAIRLKTETNQRPLLPVERSDRRITIMLRLLAAASVCLFLVFGYEQYVVIDQIRRLEKQNAIISQNSQYGSTVKINRVINLLKTYPHMLKQYKGISMGKEGKLSLLTAAIFLDAAMNDRNDLMLAKIIQNKASPFTLKPVNKQIDSINQLIP